MCSRFTSGSRRSRSKPCFSSTMTVHMTRKEVQEMLDIGKTRFFALLADYRQDASAFSVAYERTTHSRLPQATEDALQRELREEKALVEDKRLPISSYNYSAVRDKLDKDWHHVSRCPR